MRASIYKLQWHYTKAVASTTPSPWLVCGSRKGYLLKLSKLLVEVLQRLEVALQTEAARANHPPEASSVFQLLEQPAEHYFSEGAVGAAHQRVILGQR